MAVARGEASVADYAGGVTPRNPFERLPQAVAEAVVAKIVEAIDVDAIVKRVDVNDIIERVDVNRVMERVDVDQVVARVNVDDIVARVNVDDIVARVDLDELVARLDVNAIADRLDVNAIADRLDIDQLLERTEISSIIARSTSGVLTEFLDLLRRQAVSLDDLFDRLTRRRQRFPNAPSGPVPTADDQAGKTGPDNRQGHYAGAVSRLFAMVIDGFAAWALFLLGVGATQATISLFLSRPPDLFHHHWLTALFAIPFFFFYFQFQWSLGGRTIGMAFVGIRVVRTNAERVTQRHAARRTIVLPFSIGLLGLGLVGLVLRPDRRTMHDHAADTCVLYDWDAQAARLRWLEPRH